jgi:hypothetical protein
MLLVGGAKSSAVFSDINNNLAQRQRRVLRSRVCPTGHLREANH